MKRVLRVAMTGLLMCLGACREHAVPVALVEPPHIAWFAGSMDQAWAAAQAQSKPLLVYWGAVWCPYCQALKKSVFTRADFIEKTKLFIPVYLDGDLPGAQVWGERLKVSGYPTMLVVRADHSEIARLSGGMDLSLYASLIDQAIRDERPIRAVLSHVQTAADCHRLAYYGWDLGAPDEQAPGLLADALSAAAAQCPGPDQLRLEALALSIALRAQGNAAELKRQVQALFDRMAHPDSVRTASDVLAGLDESLYAVVTSISADFAAQFRERFVARMLEAASAAELSESDRLIALASALDATKALSVDLRIPQPLQDMARVRVAAALGPSADRFTRNDLVNAVGIVDDVLGDDEAAYQMYLRELPNTHTPYYYMSHLAALDEKRGKPQAALDWLSRAYAASSGPATRVRWGTAYVRGLIRLAPSDAARIRLAALQVAADMATPDARQGRSQAATDRLRKALTQWATSRERQAVAADITAHLPSPSSPAGG